MLNLRVKSLEVYYIWINKDTSLISNKEHSITQILNQESLYFKKKLNILSELAPT